MRQILTTLLIFTCAIAHAQTQDTATKVTDPVIGAVRAINEDVSGEPITVTENGQESTYMYVEKMPEPTFDFYKYLEDNTPQHSELKKPVRITVKFIIRKNGVIDSIRVLDTTHPKLHNDAIKVIASMPKWIPGKQNGKHVDVLYTLPVTFKPE